MYINTCIYCIRCSSSSEGEGTHPFFRRSMACHCCCNPQSVSCELEHHHVLKVHHRHFSKAINFQSMNPNYIPVHSNYEIKQKLLSTEKTPVHEPQVFSYIPIYAFFSTGRLFPAPLSPTKATTSPAVTDRGCDVSRITNCLARA